MTIVTKRSSHPPRVGQIGHSTDAATKPASPVVVRPFPVEGKWEVNGRGHTTVLVRRLLVVAGALFLIGALWLNRQPVMDLLALLGDQEGVSAYLRSFGAWGPVVLALTQLIQVLAAFIPGHVFLVAAGYVYGFPVGLLLNLAYTVSASQLAFALARWAGMPLVKRLVPADVLGKWQSFGERQGFAFFLIAFLLPVFPSDAMNFVAGLSGISARRFLAANFLGRLPGAIILTLIGSHGLQMSPATWAVIAALVVTIYVAGRLCVSRLERPLRPVTLPSPID